MWGIRSSCRWRGSQEPYLPMCDQIPFPAQIGRCRAAGIGLSSVRCSPGLGWRACIQSNAPPARAHDLPSLLSADQMLIYPCFSVLLSAVKSGLRSRVWIKLPGVHPVLHLSSRHSDLVRGRLHHFEEIVSDLLG